MSHIVKGYLKKMSLDADGESQLTFTISNESYAETYEIGKMTRRELVIQVMTPQELKDAAKPKVEVQDAQSSDA